MMTLLTTIRSARTRRRQYEVREYEDALRERAEALEAAGRAKDEFLAMLGHELRNPLGAIMIAGRILDQAEVGVRHSVQPREVAR